MSEEFPGAYRAFKDRYPAVWQAYDGLGRSCHEWGPLEAKSRQLVKLGIAIGAQHEGAVHSHVRKARMAGASEEEIRHVALLAIPTIGFPPSMAALTWLEDILGGE